MSRALCRTAEWATDRLIRLGLTVKVKDDHDVKNTSRQRAGDFGIQEVRSGDALEKQLIPSKNHAHSRRCGFSGTSAAAALPDNVTSDSLIFRDECTVNSSYLVASSKKRAIGNIIARDNDMPRRGLRRRASAVVVKTAGVEAEGVDVDKFGAEIVRASGKAKVKSKPRRLSGAKYKRKPISKSALSKNTISRRLKPPRTPPKNHPTVSAKEMETPTEPAVGFPDNWVTRRIPRKITKKNSCQGTKRFDLYWYSPVLGLKFRSKPEVSRFLAALDDSGGDEAAAIASYGNVTATDRVGVCKGIVAPSASKKDMHFPTEPAVGFPNNWVTRRIPRKITKKNSCQGTTKFDLYWYSPLLGLKFRSKPEVSRFLAALDDSGGDEAAAFASYGRRR